MKTAHVEWRGNNAKIECILHDNADGFHPTDRLELIITPGRGNGTCVSYRMNLEDAWAIVGVVSNMALNLQMGK